MKKTLFAGLTALLLVGCSSGTTPDTTDRANPVIGGVTAPEVTTTGSVTFSAAATDNVAVKEVQFYLDGQALIADTTSPYEAVKSFTSADNGQHTLKVIAVDTSGNKAESSKTFTVNIPVIVTPPADTTKPTVSLQANTTTLTSAGSVTYTATATDNVGISKVEFFEGTTLLGTGTTLTRSYTSADNGQHTITVKATDTSGNTSTDTVTVTVNIPVIVTPPADTIKPTVSVSSSTASLTSAGNITYTATATDNVGISKVEFFEGSTLLSSSTSAPYTLTKAYTNADNGQHTITVKATDTSGNSSTATVTVAVNIPAPVVPDTTNPTISAVTAPDVTSTTSVTFSAAATDNVAIKEVQFYLDNQALNVDATSPYEAVKSFTSADNGQHTLKVVAVDTSGNKAESSKTFTVSIPVPDTTKPTVSVQASTTTLTSAGSITYTATATDNVGISKVEFFEGTTLLGTGNTLTRSYTSADNGQHTITVKATDTSGNTNTATVTVTVNIPMIVTPPADTTNPTITVITAPDVKVASYVTFSAAATDNVAIKEVQFYLDGQALNVDATSPYEAVKSFTSADNGQHTLKVVAVDTSGNKAESSKTFTVSIPIYDTTKPTITIESSVSLLTSDGSVVYQAKVVDNVGISKVEFYEGGQLLKTATTNPYSYIANYTAADNGVHTIRAVAYDTSGNTAEAMLPIMVNIPVPIASSVIRLSGLDYGSTAGGQCASIHAMLTYMIKVPGATDDSEANYTDDASRPKQDFFIENGTNAASTATSITVKFTSQEQKAKLWLECWNDQGQNSGMSMNSYYYLTPSIPAGSVFDSPQIDVTQYPSLKLAPAGVDSGVILSISGVAPTPIKPAPTLMKN